MRRKILAVLVVLCLCELALATDPNLVAHWKFDEGTGSTAYDSASNYDGTLAGEPNWVAGQVGIYALSFDSDGDYIDFGDIDEFEFGDDDFTISFWLNTQGPHDAGGDQSGFGAIFSKYSYNLGKQWFFQQDSSGKINFATYTPTAEGLISQDGYQNQWVHCVGVRQGHTKFLYINGQENNTGSCLGVQTGQNTKVFIGAIEDFSHHYQFFNGLIDDVRVYDKALSAEEVEHLYQEGTPIGLVWLQIAGPNQIGDKLPVQYWATAHYDDNSTKDVTDLADWLVDPNIYCSIDNAGLLTPEQINTLQQNVTIYAQYTKGSNSVVAQKDITIFPICPAGYALAFDGVDDYVDCGIYNYGPTTGFSWAAWVKTNRSTQQNQAVFSHQDLASCEDMRLSIHDTSESTYGFVFRVDPCSQCPRPANDKAFWNPPGGIIPNQWYHLAGVMDYTNNKIQLFVDGIKKAQSDWTGTPINRAMYAKIGSSTHLHPYWPFNGLIDEVVIYDQPLSEQEIQHLMLTGPVDDSNLIAYWDLNEGEGNIAHDMSSNSNDGTIYGAAWSDDVPLTGICSLEEIVERNLTDVLDMKDNVIGILDAALAKEQIVLNMLNTVFKNRDFGDTPKKDVIRVKQKVHSAIQHERHAKKSVNRSINKLEDALAIFGIEPGDGEGIPSAGEQTPMTADINADGVIDTRDFVIMAKYWLATCETE